MTADELITSLKKAPNTKDTLGTFLSEIEDVDGWVVVNKPYKKTVSPLRLEILLENDREYVTLLDSILRTKQEEISSENFDISRYDFLTSAYLDRKVPYATWEFREEFEDICKKCDALNKRLGLLLQPLYVQLEERRVYLMKFVANKTNVAEILDGFVTLSLPSGPLEILVEFRGKRGHFPLTPEVESFIETFVDMDALYVIAYRVIKKPSILTRIGKRLGLCT